MYLKEQSYVCELAQTGNISQAAERLFITQPALSTYIKSLESRLGAPLFTRKEGVYVPTYLGELYLEKARKMLALQNAFNIELGLIQDGVKGRLSIGVQTRRSPIIMCHIMELMKREYPNIELHVEEGNYEGLRRLLLRNRIDLMICSVDRPEPTLHTRLIGKEVLLFAVHHKSPLLQHTVVRPGDEYPLIDLHAAERECFFLPHPGQSLRADCERLFEQSGFMPAQQMLIRSIETSLRLVSHGYGVAFNRSGYMQALAHIPHLNYLRILQDKESSEFSIFYRPENGDSVPFRRLIDRLAKMLSEQFAQT